MPEGSERSAAARRATPRERAEEHAAPLSEEDRAQMSEQEYRERERERDRSLPLHERRAEFLTDDERTEQVEDIHRRAPHGYSPTANCGD